MSFVVVVLLFIMIKHFMVKHLIWLHSYKTHLLFLIESFLTEMKHFYIHVLFLQCTGEILLYESKNKIAIICQFVFILKLFMSTEQ